MKTEKRLTMALSVLVALMMLAVPLASSSNLFVDGGQTNSNGDAPSLGAATGYTITFQLNADGNSLDQTNIPTLSELDTFDSKVAWYVGENDTILAVVSNDPGASSGNITIQQLINVLFDDDSNDSKITKGNYTLYAWNDENGNSYDSTTSADDAILSSMTFAAQWELDENCVEVPVTVNFDGEITEYVKAYAVTDGNITVDDEAQNALKTAIATIGGISTNGYVINGAESTTDALGSTPVYSNGVITYGDNRTLPSTGIIPSTSSLTVTYTFKDAQYSKLTVHSIAFKDGEDVTLYVSDDAPYTYNQIFTALLDGKISAIAAEAVEGTVNYETTDGKYLLTGWDNGTANLTSAYPTTAVEFTLDAQLNGYSVVFMVNGQYEVVFVNFGELTADQCTLDVSGLNHWVWIPFSGEGSLASYAWNDENGNSYIENDIEEVSSNPFSAFNFNMASNVNSIETLAAADGYTDPDVPVAAIIACFESSANTAYAVFDADTGYFGDNENITKIVIPGKANTLDEGSNGANISLPSSNPVYEANTVFIGYGGYVSSGEGASKYGAVNTTGHFAADAEPYDYTITFQDENNIIGILYMEAVQNNLSYENLKGAVAVQYNGRMYNNNDDVTRYLERILTTDKDGYTIKQWNNADGERMISITYPTGEGETTFATTNNFTSLTSNLVLYADFDAESYTITYVNTFGGTQTQGAYVDQNVTLYGNDTFIHEGYTLIGWSTIPGNSGTNYNLGGTFVLNGADYEDLSSKNIELYSVWEYNGGSDVPSGNTDGGDSNDNTALYLIAGMLAVIAVLAIVGIVLMRKK